MNPLGAREMPLPPPTPTHSARSQVLATYTNTMRPVSPPRFLINTADSALSVLPLDVGRFDGLFEYFCAVKRLVLGQELSRVKGKNVRLHSPHAEVMKHRGYNIHEVRR